MVATRTSGVLGTRVDEVDTPALFVDLDALDRNVARMAATITGSGVGWRDRKSTRLNSSH